MQFTYFNKKFRWRTSAYNRFLLTLGMAGIHSTICRSVLCRDVDDTNMLVQCNDSNPSVLILYPRFVQMLVQCSASFEEGVLHWFRRSRILWLNTFVLSGLLFCLSLKISINLLHNCSIVVLIPLRRAEKWKKKKKTPLIRCGLN